MSVRLAGALLFVGVVSVVAQEMFVPVEVQAGLLVKALAFDRALPARAGQEVVIGVAYQGKYGRSAEAKDELLRAAERLGPQRLAGAPVRWVSIDLGGGVDLAAALRRLSIDALYVCPLRAVKIGELSAITRQARVLTCTGVPAYVYEGLALGIGLKGDRPQLIVKLKAAREEGADFDARLLKLSKVLE